MGKYEHIMTKQSDVQYKIMMANIAVANELDEANRLKRIDLAVQIIKLDSAEKKRVEAEIAEDLDLTEQTG